MIMRERLSISRGTMAIFMLSMFVLPFMVSAQTPILTLEERQRQLEAELSGIDQEIAGLSNTIGGLQNEKQSLGRDIKLLNATIERANLNVKAKMLQISRLGDGIADKERAVSDLEKRIERERQSLAQLIKKTNELDQTNFIELMLTNENISEALIDLDSFDAVRDGLKNSTDALKSVKSDTEAAKKELEERQRKEADAKAELERNRRIVQQNEKDKQQLLSITKNKEKEYQTVLSDRKKKAAQIRAALFALRDSGEIPFGKALEYANLVNQVSGVRPAFLLAVFMQESSFGKNQGSCYVKASDGSGVSVKSGKAFAKVMHATRDLPPFLEITKSLGRDPYNTLVSCPQEVGYGGAMGAAQFIPSTWVMYEKKVMKGTGASVADPWSARDAFMAAGLYLSDIGAGSGSYSGERDAACRYFSGKKCSASSWAATYGTQVMQKATNIQETMIDPLQNI